MDQLVLSKTEIQKEVEQTINHIVSGLTGHSAELRESIKKCFNYRFISEEIDSSKGTLSISLSDRDILLGVLPPWELAWHVPPTASQMMRLSSLLSGLADYIIIRKRGQQAINDRTRCNEAQLEFTSITGKSVLIPIGEIIYIESDLSNSNVYYGHGVSTSKIPVVGMVGEHEDRLGHQGFIRIHRKYIVHTACVKEITTTSGKSAVLLCTGTILPIARRRRNRVQEVFTQSDHSLINPSKTY